MEKTAMTELIEQLKKRKDEIKGNSFPQRCRKGAYTDAILLATELLPKEREQIIDAYKNGFYAGCDQPLMDNMPDDYFTQTYNQK